MTLTVERAGRHIKDALGTDPKLPYAEFVNGCGAWLFSLHPWNFLQRPEGLLSLVADQDWIDLPADFAEMVAPIQITSGSGVSGAMPVSMEVLTQARESGIGSPIGTIFYALEYSAQTGPTPPTPRLAIYPAPTTATADAFRIAYRVKWTDLANDSDYIPIPGFLEPLFIQGLRAFALGWDEQDEGNLEVRLEPLRNSKLFQDALRADGAAVSFIGKMGGGAVQSRYAPAGYWPKIPPTAIPLA